MASDFPFLDSLADEIAKVRFETEEQARTMVQKDLVELRAKKDEAFTLAKTRIAAHGAAIEGMKTGLNKVIDKLSNSGETQNPTGQNSSDNSNT
jgi:hypothetical protein